MKPNIAKNARMKADTKTNRSEKDLGKIIERIFWTSAGQPASEITTGVKKRKRQIMVGKGVAFMDIIRRIYPDY